MCVCARAREDRGCFSFVFFLHRFVTTQKATLSRTPTPGVLFQPDPERRERRVVESEKEVGGKEEKAGGKKQEGSA